MAKESFRHQNKPIKKITTEDVLKKFLDSKAKSTKKPEPTRTSEKSLMRSKNIFHGVHIPPKILAPSLRRKENKYFYFSTVSNFEGSVHGSVATSRTTTTKFTVSKELLTSQPVVSPALEATLFSSKSSSYCGSFTNKTVQNVEAEPHRESIKT